MTQEEKQLLLKDLCARLPYGVICQLSNKDANVSIIEKLELSGLEHFIAGSMCVKPYLRPMSSMTEEERVKMGNAIQKDYISPYGEIKSSGVDNLLLCSIRQATNLIDWLNSHYFDYHGLIEKGLALEAPKDMYKTE